MLNGFKTANKRLRPTPFNSPKLFKIIGKVANKRFVNNKTGEIFKKNKSSHEGDNYNDWNSDKSYKKTPNKRQDSVWADSGESRGR